MPLVEVNDITDPRLQMYSHQRDTLLLDWPGYPNGLFVGESANVIVAVGPSSSVCVPAPESASVPSSRSLAVLPSAVPDASTISRSLLKRLESEPIVAASGKGIIS